MAQERSGEPRRTTGRLTFTAEGFFVRYRDELFGSGAEPVRRLTERAQAAAGRSEGAPLAVAPGDLLGEVRRVRATTLAGEAVVELAARYSPQAVVALLDETLRAGTGEGLTGADAQQAAEAVRRGEVRLFVAQRDDTLRGYEIHAKASDPALALSSVTTSFRVELNRTNPDPGPIPPRPALDPAPLAELPAEIAGLVPPQLALLIPELATDDPNSYPAEAVAGFLSSCEMAALRQIGETRDPEQAREVVRAICACQIARLQRRVTYSKFLALEDRVLAGRPAPELLQGAQQCADEAADDAADEPS